MANRNILEYYSDSAVVPRDTDTTDDALMYQQSILCQRRKQNNRAKELPTPAELARFYMADRAAALSIPFTDKTGFKVRARGESEYNEPTYCTVIHRNDGPVPGKQ